MSRDPRHLEGGRLEERLPDKKPRYDAAEARFEAYRCIYCSDAPCVQACPTGIDIPTFIHKLSTGNVRGAARTIFEENLLGRSCARVCPVEVLCAGSCVVGEWGREPIAIGRLQRFATEAALELDPALLAPRRLPKTGKRIALIGAGPASLACAGQLALDGHEAVILEMRDIPGGLNTYGIAPYKMQAEDALREVEFIESLGSIEIRTGVQVVAQAQAQADAPRGTQLSAASLLADFDAIFIGIGLGPDSALGIPGEEGEGVMGATALIERIKRDPSFSLEGVRAAAIIGGGNTAIDAARELALLGVPEVVMIYRRGSERMSGYVHEMAKARQEGVRLIEARQPVEVLREQGKLVGLRLAETVDGEPQPGATQTLRCDLVATAIGQARLTELAAAFEGVELDARGRVRIEESSCRTGHPLVYAGGDCVNGGKEVVNAAQHGKLAARAITRTFSEGAG
ncbi:MAG: FAD-dependent oxidoreductase [Myxococcales bacterium]|nr:FAD-dependent oxidoreductase [Myxococcales bacterium]